MDPATSEKVVYGYIRQNTPLNIPVTLINLCVSFCCNVFGWIIYGNQLQNIKQGANIKDTEVFLKDEIKFHCVLFPDGWNEETVYNTTTRDAGSAILSLEMPSYPTHKLKYFVMYYELKCKQLHLLWKGIDEFESNEDVAAWNSKTLSSLELKQAFNKNGGSDRLHIEYKMNVLYIKYATWREYFIKCSMPKYIEFTWELTDKLIEIVDPLNIDKTNVETRYYSENNFLNDCWCLYIKRSEDSDDTNIYWNIGVCLLKLPPKIKKIATEIEIIVNDEVLELENDSYQFDKLLFSYAANTKRGGYSYPIQETPPIKLYDLFQIDPLKSVIKIRIFIKDIFTRDRFGGVGRYERVKKREWNQYHIIP